MRRLSAAAERPTPPPPAPAAEDSPKAESWWSLDPEILFEDLKFRLFEIRCLRRDLFAQYKSHPVDSMRSQLWKVLALEQDTVGALTRAERERGTGWCTGRYVDSMTLPLNEILRVWRNAQPSSR
jgi:hypothetical protein